MSGGLRLVLRIFEEVSEDMKRNRAKFRRLNIASPTMADVLAGTSKGRSVWCPRLSIDRAASRCVFECITDSCIAKGNYQIFCTYGLGVDKRLPG